MGSFRKGLLLSLGLVKAQVDLHATSPDPKSRFHRLCPDHEARIKQKYVCEDEKHVHDDGSPVFLNWGEWVSGIDTPDGTRVVDPENKPEFEKDAELNLTPVPVKELAGATYTKGGSYYLQPTPATAVMWQALRAILRKGKVAFVAKGQLKSGDQKLWQISLVNDYLAIQQLVFPEHVRSVPEVVTAKPSREEQSLMNQLVEQQITSLDKLDLIDENVKLVEKYIESGKVIKATTGGTVTPITPAVDFKDALAASIKATKKKGVKKSA
jgi:non-homologous end joining protein Ku